MRRVLQDHASSKSSLLSTQASRLLHSALEPCEATMALRGAIAGTRRSGTTCRTSRTLTFVSSRSPCSRPGPGARIRPPRAGAGDAQRTATGSAAAEERLLAQPKQTAGGPVGASATGAAQHGQPLLAGPFSGGGAGAVDLDLPLAAGRGGRAAEGSNHPRHAWPTAPAPARRALHRSGAAARPRAPRGRMPTAAAEHLAGRRTRGTARPGRHRRADLAGQPAGAGAQRSRQRER